MKQLKFMWLLVVLLALAACGKQEVLNAVDATSTAVPTISSDKEDYAPGELVNLAGSNWQPGESVHINVDDDQTKTWERNVDVTADENGDIVDKFNLPSHFVATYQVTATGDVSGVAKTSFTDGNISTRAGGIPSSKTITVAWASWNGTKPKPNTNCSGDASKSGNAIVGTSNWVTTAAAGSVDSARLTAPEKVDGDSFVNWTEEKDGKSTVVSTSSTFCIAGSDAAPNFQANYAAAPPTPRTTTTTVTRSPNANTTYGDSLTFTATVTATDGNPNGVGKVTFKNGSTDLCKDVALSGNTATCSPSLNAASYNITAQYSGTTSGSPTFGGSTSTALSHTVNPKQLTGSFTASNKEYDGNTSATVTGRSLTGVLTADEGKVSLSGGTASFGAKAVGTDKTVTLAGASLAGDADGNYSLSSVSTATANITPKNLTVSGLSAANKEYDGGFTATITGNATLSGKVDSDDVSLSGTVSGTFADRNVGNDKVVTISSVSLQGDDKGNYTLTQPSGLKANITAKSITGSFTAADKQYDGNTSADIAGRSLSGVIGADQVSLTGGTASFASKNVGSHAITGSGFSLGGDNKGNYSLGAVTASTNASITAKEVTGSFTTTNKKYDGNTSATVTGRSLSGAINGDNVSLDGGTASFGTKDVGTGKTVTLTGASLAGGDAGNYSLSSVSTATADITRKELTINGLSAEDKVYDGSTSAVLSGNPALNGVVSGDNVSLAPNASGAFNDKNVGNNKSVTLSGVALSGADAGNYSLTQPTGLTANITPKSVTGSFTASNKVYDGTPSATVASRSLIGAVSGDDVSLDGGTASFASKNVGSHAITGSGFSLGGDDKGNYSLGAVTASANASITAKEVTGSFTAADKPYDGTTTATILTRSLSGEIGSDAVTLMGGSATFSNADVGTSKTVTGTGFSLSGTDAGNYTLGSIGTTTASITAWTPQGFHSPIGIANSFSTAPGASVPAATSTTVWQTAKGGSTIPLKFNVFAGGTEKTSTADVKGFGAVKLSTCSGSTLDPVEELLTSGSTSLRYDSVERQFIQNWKTSTVSGDTCYRVTVTFQDASAIHSFVRLRK